MAYRVLLLEEVCEKIIINLTNTYFCDHNEKFSDHKNIFLKIKSNNLSSAQKRAALVWRFAKYYMTKQAFHRSLCKLERDHLLPELIYQT
jgi:hypothetical protein